MPSIHLTEEGGGGVEAVSGGSTWLWSSLDQGPGWDKNMDRSSPRTTEPVTLLQDWQSMSLLSLRAALNVL